ncbi:MAG: type I-G CRISPR-associated protein, Cas3-extension family [Acidobacteriaceae bacterium]
MTEALIRHRLEGLEPDNLLAFLALLGLLRSLEAADRQRHAGDKLYPRASWNLDSPPLRPVLSVAQPVTRKDVTEAAVNGLSILAASHNFGENNRKDLNYPRDEARAMLAESARAATALARDAADLLAALMCDAAVKKEDKSPDAAPIAPTPLCLLFGQGHQHFLDRLAKIPAEAAPPTRGKGKAAVMLSPTECLAEALFAPWHREDPTFSFRWDPEEDVRYALMAGDPTDSAYKGGTQHGANRLAAVGLAALTLIPETRGGQIRPTVLGGSSSTGSFSFAWPIWKEPATLSAIRALLGHRDLRKSGQLIYLGVDHVLVANRISVGKFMNFTRARIADRD